MTGGTVFTSAYRREIDDRGGWTSPVQVSVHRLWDGDPDEIQLRVGGGRLGESVSLDLAHARQLREALDEAIMLVELVGDEGSNEI